MRSRFLDVQDVHHRLLRVRDRLPLVERQRRLVRPLPLLLGEPGRWRAPASTIPAVLLLELLPGEARSVAAPLDGVDEVEPLPLLDERVEVETLPGRVVERDVLAAALEDREARVPVLAQRRAAEDARLACLAELLGVASLDELPQGELVADLVLVALEERLAGGAQFTRPCRSTGTLASAPRLAGRASPRRGRRRRRSPGPSRTTCESADLRAVWSSLAPSPGRPG